MSSEREVQLGTIPVDDPNAAWFAVRNVFRSGEYYEERIKLWNAPTSALRLRLLLLNSWSVAYGFESMPADSRAIHPGHGLEKAVWTDADFGIMGWHDCKVYALALVQDDEDDFAGRVFLDIDYIVRWADGEIPGKSFSFWISPATLVFHGVYELGGSVSQPHRFPQAFEIEDLIREPVDDRLAYDRWFLGPELSINFRAAGYRQIMRREPMHVPTQHLTMEARGGVSFSDAAYDGSPSALAVTHTANPPIVQRLEQFRGQ